MFKNIEKFKYIFPEKEKSIPEKITSNKNENSSKQNSFFVNGNRTPLIPFTKTKTNFMTLESTTAAKLSTSMNLTKLIKSIPHIHKPQTSYNFERPKNLNAMNNFEININNSNNNNNNNNNNKNSKIFSFANTEKIRISQRKFGIIHSYSAITSEGQRNYNEDRVSIIYNITKPQNTNNWPHCSFFGLYDGHAGNSCADFLRDNLHKFIINDKHFPQNPKKSIFNGFLKAESVFLKEFGEKKFDSSGSCAIIILIIENRCFIANVGDSRAILSGKNGTKNYALSRDHRPNDEKEYKRILDAGGKIYQTEYKNYNDKIIGPLRVYPGKLSVSRTIGDFEAKDSRFGGNSNVIISIPEIKYFDINDEHDFILIGCDGIFEKMKNKQIIDCVWNCIDKNNFVDVHNLTGVCAEKVIEECLNKESSDNLTLIMICLKGIEKLKKGKGTFVPQTEICENGKQKGIFRNNNKNVINNNNNNHCETPFNIYNFGNILKKNNNNNDNKNKIRQPLSVLLTKLVKNNYNNINNNKNVSNNKNSSYNNKNVSINNSNSNSYRKNYNNFNHSAKKIINMNYYNINNKK